MIGAAIALFATAASSGADGRSLTEAIDVAIDFCAATASGRPASLGGGMAFYSYASGPMVDVLRAQGMKTTDELPSLIKRFAATSVHSRAVGHRDIVAIGAGDGVVWLVRTADQRLCDIGVTEIDDASQIPSSVSEAVTGNENWVEVSNETNGPLWRATFERREPGSEEEDQADANITASGLIGEHAGPEGIQAELNFSAAAESTVAQ